MNVACLIPNTLLGPTSHLVLDTLRIGFPSARVHLYLNMGDNKSRPLDLSNAEIDDFTPVTATPSEWLVSLLGAAQEDVEPLVVVDSDVIFYDSVEAWEPERLLSGFPVPNYFSDLTDCLHMYRLHTSMLWIQTPAELWSFLKHQRASLRLPAAFEEYMPSDLVTPDLTYINGCPIFYDIASKLCHAAPCESFSVEMLDRFTHVTAGSTYHDTKTMFKNPEERATFEGMHALALEQPDALRGLWRQQANYYDSKAMTLGNYLAAYQRRRTAP